MPHWACFRCTAQSCFVLASQSSGASPLNSIATLRARSIWLSSNLISRSVIIQTWVAEAHAAFDTRDTTGLSEPVTRFVVAPFRVIYSWSHSSLLKLGTYEGVS